MSETKEKVKHTQGEWKAEHNLITNGYNTLASVNTIFLPEGEPEANAKLISAAPDLLEALKEMLRHTDGNCAELPTTTFSKAERNARAAIEKATL